MQPACALFGSDPENGQPSNEIAGTMALAAGCISVLAAAFLTARMTGEKGCSTGSRLPEATSSSISLIAGAFIQMWTSPPSVCAWFPLHFAARSAAFLALGEKVKFGF